METASRKIDDQEVIQLRYGDHEGTLSEVNAYEVAEVLEGLVALSSELGKSGLFGDGPPPEVKVRPIREGSFIIEAVLQWTAQNPEGALTVAGGTGASLAGAVRFLTKGITAKPKDFEHLDNGNVKVIWQDDTAEEVPKAAWTALQGKSSWRRTKGSLRKIMAPLSDEADFVQVRTGQVAETTIEIEQSEPRVELDRQDYRAAAAKDAVAEERSHEFSTEGSLLTVDFVRDGKWRIATKEGKRKAAVEDEDFLRRVDQGLALHKTDIFRFRIREDVVLNERRKTTWTIVEVEQHRRGAYDGDDVGADATPEHGRGEETR